MSYCPEVAINNTLITRGLRRRAWGVSPSFPNLFTHSSLLRIILDFGPRCLEQMWAWDFFSNFKFKVTSSVSTPRKLRLEFEELSLEGRTKCPSLWMGVVKKLNPCTGWDGMSVAFKMSIWWWSGGKVAWGVQVVWQVKRISDFPGTGNRTECITEQPSIDLPDSSGGSCDYFANRGFPKWYDLYLPICARKCSMLSFNNSATGNLNFRRSDYAESW